MAFSATFLLALRAVGAIVFVLAVRFLYKAYVQRSTMRALQAQGIPLLPHSWIFGHLKIFGDWRAENPADANIYSFHVWLIKNVKRYFPDRDFPPPVVYLDIWPVEVPFVVVFDPAMAAQFTQTPSFPKQSSIVDFLEPLTGGQDIVCAEGAEWKTWRSRFNPGFSQRNLIAMLPELISEVSTFASQIAAKAGEGGKWGSMFQLEEKTTNLTFDVISMAALGLRLNEQRRTEPSPLKEGMLQLIEVMNSGANVARALPIGRMPWQTAAAKRYNAMLRDALMPAIKTTLQGESKDSQVKTIVELAVKYVDQDDPSATREKPNAEFVDRLISNLKAFLFAGHDTTATTICFMMKHLQDKPACLDKMRAEHDAVLGPDPSKAEEVLRASPHLLYSLPYTLGVIKETLRLNPLAATMRHAPEGAVLVGADSTSTSYPVGGWAVWLSAPGVALHPDYWPRPNEFIPERWTVPEGDPLHFPAATSAWAPFSLGPRNCIGMELALIELRIVAVFLARRFDIQEAWDEFDKQKQPSPDTPRQKVFNERLYWVGNGTVHPKDGMPVRVRLREHSSAVSA
ncbi:vera protein [Xylariaceae sp. FL0594]|nr:vera protein [Xylariaceae sp. FL0594]